AEPFLDATIHPQVLFPAYLAGFNLAESFYLGMPYLSWQTIIVGDPLCAPFARRPLTTEQLDKGVDPDTGLPALFVERRIALLARSGLNVGAIKLTVGAEVDFPRGNEALGEQRLVKASDLEPRLTQVDLRLAA